MKTLLTFKADIEDADKWREACRIDGRTVSEICRASLERLSKRIEKASKDGEA